MSKKKKKRRDRDQVRLPSRTLPLPAEVIERVFAVGSFSDKDAAVCARVSRDKTWQRCVREVLWRTLDLMLCLKGPKASHVDLERADGCVFLHNPSRKTRAAIAKPKKTRTVKELYLSFPNSAPFCWINNGCPTPWRLAKILSECAAALEVLEVSFTKQEYKKRFKSLAWLLRAHPMPRLRQLRFYDLGDWHGGTVPREQDIAEALVAQQPERPGERLFAPTVILSSVSHEPPPPSYWPEYLPRNPRLNPIARILKRLDLSITTSLTLHGNALRSFKPASLPRHLVSLDLTFVPCHDHVAYLVGEEYEYADSSDDQWSAQNETRGLMNHLVALASLRSLTIRFDTPTQATYHSQRLIKRLHASYPPGLRHLAFKTHTPSNLSLVPAGTTSTPFEAATNFAYGLLWDDSFDDLTQAVQRVFLDLATLEMPAVPLRHAQTAAQRVSSSAALEEWRSFGGKLIARDVNGQALV